MQAHGPQFGSLDLPGESRENELNERWNALVNVTFALQQYHFEQFGGVAFGVLARIARQDCFTHVEQSQQVVRVGREGGCIDRHVLVKRWHHVREVVKSIFFKHLAIKNNNIYLYI